MKKISNLKRAVLPLTALLMCFSVGSITAAPLLANLPVGIMFEDNTSHPTPFSLTMSYTINGFTGDITEYKAQPGFSESFTVAPNSSVGQAQEFELVTHVPGKTPSTMSGSATIPSFAVTPTGSGADATDTVTIPALTLTASGGQITLTPAPSLIKSVKGDYFCVASTDQTITSNFAFDVWCGQ